MAATRFRLNDKRVVFEVFDAELLAVNLDTGIYYAIGGSGPALWSWIISGAEVTAVVQAAQARFDGDPAAIASAVTQFADKLAAEALVVPDDGPAPAPLPAGDAAAARVAFVPPVIDTHADMQDMLLLDPIHDVDERGWPLTQPIAAPKP
jgi:hypothetical protein